MISLLSILYNMSCKIQYGDPLTLTPTLHDAPENLLTILISSCDTFADCWAPFAHGLAKYWPDCPFQALLITNHKTFDHHKIKAYAVGKDSGWAINLLKAIGISKTPYILYIQDDNWIKQTVDTPTILKYLELFQSNQVDYLRLYPCPQPQFPSLLNENLGVLSTNEPYRTSLQAAIWRKSALLDLINPKETAWQFELEGSVRSRKYGERFLSVRRFFDALGPYHKGIDTVCTAINKGRWAKAAIEYARHEGLSIDFSKRPHETWWHEFLRSDILGKLTKRIISRLMRASNSHYTKRRL